MDSSTTVEDLKKAVASFRDARDWKRFHNPKDLAASISIEANELLELFQWKDKDEVDQVLRNPEKFQRIREEIADIVIYCLSACESLKIDLSETIQTKLAENSAKYPANRTKGLARKYTEL